MGPPPKSLNADLKNAKTAPPKPPSSKYTMPRPANLAAKKMETSTATVKSKVTVGSTIEEQISRRIDKNKNFLDKLLAMEKPPQYALSLLQSARHNKGKVLEAHLSVITGVDRLIQVN